MVPAWVTTIKFKAYPFSLSFENGNAKELWGKIRNCTDKYFLEHPKQDNGLSTKII